MSLAADLLRRSAMRTALAISGVFTIALAICGVWIVTQFRAEVREDIDTQLQMTHEEAATATEAELRDWFEDHDEFAVFTDSWRTPDGDVFGALRSRVFDTPGFQTLSTEDLFAPRFITDLTRSRDEFDDGDPILDVDMWRVFVGPAGGGQFAAFEPVGIVEGALDLIPRIMLVVGAALVLTTLLAGAIMAWRQQIRLDRVREGIARIGRGDLSHPMAPAHPRDDLDDIMIGIDAAAAELGASIGRMRLFSQNVAHELRTPLARLRATLEDAPGAPEAALERTDEVIRTLDAVQRIARLSHQPDPNTLGPVALRDVAVLGEELFAEVAAEAGQTLRVVLDDPAVVQGDFQLLAQMLSNLVENAIRYAGPGADITIRAAGPRITVQDTGPGITSPEDMTQPFARAAEARAQTGAADGAQTGTGLGLALVKTIAQYHGADLTLVSEGGLRAEVAFPNA